MKVLFVCAGNIMRSVIAESVLRARADELLGEGACVFEAESSGLEAEENSSPHPDCVSALEYLGVPASGTTATRADERHMKESDLAIAMTRQQSYLMASRFPGQKQKVFSLIEINGAIYTLLTESGQWEEMEKSIGEALRLPLAELDGALVAAADGLKGAPRELTFPIAGVPLSIRELMTLFPSCFHQVSGVHDPIGGTEEEARSCARQIEKEVTEFIRGMLALAGSNPSM